MSNITDMLWPILLGVTLPLACMVAQVVTLVLLGRVLARRDRLLPAGLARHFCYWLIIAPGLELMFYGGLLGAAGGYPDEPHFLEFMQEEGAIYAAAAWVVLAICFCVQMSDTRRLYTGWRGLVVTIAMAALAGMLSGTYLACLPGSLSRLLDYAFRSATSWEMAGLAWLNVVTFAIPTLPLLGLLMLIVHVARVRAALACEAEARDAGPDETGER